MNHSKHMKVFEWFDCKDRLPPPGKYVLVWDCGDIYEGYLENGEWHPVMDIINAVEVKFWAETPYNPIKVNQILAIQKK